MKREHFIELAQRKGWLPEAPTPRQVGAVWLWYLDGAWGEPPITKDMEYPD